MAGEGRDRRLLLGADADRLAAIPAVFRGQHELMLETVVIAFRPAEIGTLPLNDQFLGRLLGALFYRVQLWPVLPELVAAVHRRENPAGGIKRDALAVAQTRHEAFRRREMLVQPVGVITPGAASGLQLGARIFARHVRHAVLALAGIGRGTEVDIEIARRVDREGMHRMIAGQRQSRDDGLRRPGRRDRRPAGKRVAHDAVVGLGIEIALVDRDAGAALVALRRDGPKRTILSARPLPVVS